MTIAKLAKMLNPNLSIHVIKNGEHVQTMTAAHVESNYYGKAEIKQFSFDEKSPSCTVEIK